MPFPLCALPERTQTERLPASTHGLANLFGLLNVSDFLVARKGTPACNQNDAHDAHRNASHQRGVLHTIGLHAQERNRSVVRQRADIRAGQQAKESEDVAANGIEGNAGSGVLFGQVHIQDVGIGEVQTYAEQMLADAHRNIDPCAVGRHKEEDNFRGYPDQRSKTERLDQRVKDQDESPERL